MNLISALNDMESDLHTLAQWDESRKRSVESVETKSFRLLIGNRWHRFAHFREKHRQLQPSRSRTIRQKLVSIVDGDDDEEKEHEDYAITFVRRQADWPNVVGYRHAIIKPQQRHIVIEIAVAELL
jgi:hypothetical protein